MRIEGKDCRIRTNRELLQNLSRICLGLVTAIFSGSYLIRQLQLYETMRVPPSEETWALIALALGGFLLACYYVLVHFQKRLALQLYTIEGSANSTTHNSVSFKGQSELLPIVIIEPKEMAGATFVLVSGLLFFAGAGLGLVLVGGDVILGLRRFDLGTVIVVALFAGPICLVGLACMVGATRHLLGHRHILISSSQVERVGRGFLGAKRQTTALAEYDGVELQFFTTNGDTGRDEQVIVLLHQDFKKSVVLYAGKGELSNEAAKTLLGKQLVSELDRLATLLKVPNLGAIEFESGRTFSYGDDRLDGKKKILL